jgi:hypothetical protein
MQGCYGIVRGKLFTFCFVSFSYSLLSSLPGDRILFGKWSGTEIKLDGVEYLIMKESDIMGVLVEAETRKKAA